MSYDRRWFLTASGSAFLAGIAGTLKGAQPTPTSTPTPTPTPVPTKKPKDADEAYENLVTRLLVAHGSNDEGDARIIREALEPMYRARYKGKHTDLDDLHYDLLGQFAEDIGYLTAQCLRNEKEGECGWTKNTKAVLRIEHVQRAREVLGFALNKNLMGGTWIQKCYPLPKVSVSGRMRQPDTQCPLC